MKVRNATAAAAMCWLLATGQAAAESFQILGETIAFQAAPGYCVSDNSTVPEQRIWESTQRNVQPYTRLVAWMAPCTELRQLQRGERVVLDHWLQIQVLTPGGVLRNITVGREQFLASLAAAAPNLPTETVERRMREQLEAYGMELSEPKFEMVGRDGNAMYIAMRMRIDVGNISRTIRGISSNTLVNTVPLQVNSYEATGRAAGVERAGAAMKAVLRSILTGN